MTFPTWLLSATYNDAENAYRSGRIDRGTWCAYRAIWRYSAVRFSDVVPWPRVRAINHAIATGADHITDELHSGSIVTFPLTFAD